MEPVPYLSPTPATEPLRADQHPLSEPGPIGGEKAGEKGQALWAQSFGVDGWSGLVGKKRFTLGAQ
ncbi:hypothetical protein [Hymenobacter sp. GOD-10R]|uniref:hypothetical protein n=1 Tax=Hymenobacter sp. GOD-10R TaxID=3093922 RepID=UPI002D78155F|nr:hypothetical protein [Hymenobacter sp. GOD-10R]WRQ31081.1 hypothetical protein SD425_12515 [Hymenobacter sp. GOD-10R]